MGWGNLNVFSRTTELILTRLGTNHPRIERIQVSLKEGDSPPPWKDNSKIVKIHRFFKIFFSRTSRPKSINFGTNYPSVKIIQVCSNVGTGPLQRGDNHRNVRKEWGHLKIFFLRTMTPETLNFT
jgi:hypothetical protein